MKRFLVIVLAIMLLVSSGCLFEKKSEPWPITGLGAMLPEPEGVIEIESDYDDRFSAKIYKVSMDIFRLYIEECASRGFTVESTKSSSEYEAFNADGYKLEIDMSSYSKEMRIDLRSPIELGQLKWPGGKAGQLVPVPDSTRGKVEWEDDDSFTVYVGDMTKEKYNNYIEFCTEAGFSIDSYKRDNSFKASNQEGYTLYLDYEGFNIISVQINKPSTSPTADSAGQNTTDPISTASSDVEQKVSSPESAKNLKDKNVDDVVKQFLDAGFMEIKTVGKGDLIIALLHSEGDVESISIDGDSAFAKGQQYDSTAQVVITYHSFDEEENVIVTTKATEGPTLEPTIEPTVVPTKTPTTAPTKTPTTAPTKTPTPAPTKTPTPAPTKTPTPAPTKTPTPAPTKIPPTAPIETPVATDPASLMRLCVIKGSNYLDLFMEALYNYNMSTHKERTVDLGYNEMVCETSSRYFSVWYYPDSKEILYCDFATKNVKEYEYFTDLADKALGSYMTNSIYNWIKKNIGSNNETTINGIRLTYHTNEVFTELEIRTELLAKTFELYG